MGQEYKRKDLILLRNGGCEVYDRRILQGRARWRDRGAGSEVPEKERGNKQGQPNLQRKAREIAEDVCLEKETTETQKRVLMIRGS